ncbi:MBL fold metallo-hydrolase [Eubacteriaceae bacterium ES2]|nr:MBL fold metallo-hydrolase [Eubacteriaceae bacterium ES2]
MVEKIYEKPEIYRIDIPLPNNPLKNLNSYVVKTEKENLIIDTGFDMPECLEAMQAGIRELDLDMAKTSFYLTHLHSDHTGLMNRLGNGQTKIYMGEIEYNYFKRTLSGEIRQKANNLFLAEGFPEEDLSLQVKKNPAFVYAPKKVFEAITLKDKETFLVGDLEFECVLVPGHTPGNTCLYLKSEKIMFLGDHILMHISPNITNWPDVENSLNDYLVSLDKIANYDIKLGLPAHRQNDVGVYERIGQLKKHHQERLQSIMDILKQKDYQTGYEIAGQLKWSLSGKSWETCPVSQKWFATGETLSHLDYLLHKKLIIKVEKDGSYSYRIR